MSESPIILAIRKINDRAKGLVKNYGIDNPLVQDYFAKMDRLVPDQYKRYNTDGVLQIQRSKDFEKMGYTVERDFNLDKFSGVQNLRSEYREQFKQAKEDMVDIEGETSQQKIDRFIGSMGELKGNIPLLYKNTGKKGVQDAINTLRKSKNSYEELMNVADVIRGIDNETDTTDSIGRHTILLD